MGKYGRRDCSEINKSVKKKYSRGVVLTRSRTPGLYKWCVHYNTIPTTRTCLVVMKKWSHAALCRQNQRNNNRRRRTRRGDSHVRFPTNETRPASATCSPDASSNAQNNLVFVSDRPYPPPGRAPRVRRRRPRVAARQPSASYGGRACCPPLLITSSRCCRSSTTSRHISCSCAYAVHRQYTDDCAGARRAHSSNPPAAAAGSPTHPACASDPPGLRWLPARTNS